MTTPEQYFMLMRDYNELKEQYKDSAMEVSIRRDQVRLLEDKLNKSRRHVCAAWREEGNGCFDCSRILLDYPKAPENT